VRAFGDHACLSACFSADGTILAAFGTSQPGDLRVRGFASTISLWDLATGRRLRSWTDPKGRVYCGQFTADGKTLITGGEKAVCFWDVATGKELRRLPADMPAVGHLVLSPDGKLLAGIGLKENKPGGMMFPSGLGWYSDNSIGIWDVATGKEVQHLSVPQPERPRRVVDGFTAVLFDPDGKTLITGGVDQFARRWDLATGKEVRRYDMDNPGVWALALSPDGKVLAGLPGGVTLRLVDTATGKERVTLGGHRGAVLWTALTPDNRTAVTGAAEAEAVICLWDAATGLERQRLKGQGRYLSGVLLAPGGRTVHSLLHEDNRLITWDLRTGRPVRRLSLDPNLAQMGVVALSPDGKTLALTISHGTAVTLIDPATGKELRRLKGLEPWVVQAAFAPDGATLILLCSDYSVQVWDIARGKKLRSLPPLAPFVHGAGAGIVRLAAETAALSPDGRWLAHACQGSLSLFQVASGERLYQVKTLPADAAGLIAFAPDGRTLAWASPHTPAVHLVEVATGQERRQFSGHQGRVRCLTFSTDSKLLISGSEDTTSVIWDLLKLAEQRAGESAPLDECWEDLAAGDAGRAYRAMCRLAAVPAQAVPYLEKHLPTVRGVDEKHVARLIADLDSPEFKVREKAARELDNLEAVGIPIYRKALEQEPSAEVRRRLEGLVKKHATWVGCPERVRVVRAVEVLEIIGTAPAREVLTRLAGGSPEARLTEEAQAALRRLAQRPAGSP
jgi:WD40 repeat protein